MDAQEKKDIKPLCPFCEEEIDTVWFKEVKANLGKRYVYFCPACRKVLGISHRKGFWMG